ncbi:hypothetical protein C8R43DRAFT_885795 [Mycena crocata]|nr:hypothetical protein C8R43DRAFT_885795 [Mycena crocata]
MAELPQPERDSGQRPGEDFRAFFARRKLRNEQIVMVESSVLKEQRLQREEHAVKGAAPGKKGARVFVWEEEQGIWIRRAVNRTAAADMWDEFTTNQRLYDGFRKEWDLCPPLALDEESQGSDDEEIDVEMGIAEDTRPAYDPYRDISELAGARFGFTEATAATTFEKKPFDDKLSLKSLGDEKWPRLGEARYRHLPTFLAYLHTAKSIEDIPSALLDLGQEGAEISLESNWAIMVSQEHLNGNLLYVLKPVVFPPEILPLYILLPSAATVLQVLRMGWGPDPQEIISRLIQHGVEFRVCIRHEVYRQPPPPLPDRATGLGFRRVGYKPTRIDHSIYEMYRESFFRSPRGRAALFFGGIVGRLALITVEERVASSGPSEEVFLTGVRLWDGKSSAAYWDDALTERDIDLICGVYEVATGESTSLDYILSNES